MAMGDRCVMFRNVTGRGQCLQGRVRSCQVAEPGDSPSAKQNEDLSNQDGRRRRGIKLTRSSHQ
jgi:hypothetical protein